jgi:hypothetical protein
MEINMRVIKKWNKNGKGIHFYNTDDKYIGEFLMIKPAYYYKN